MRSSLLWRIAAPYALLIILMMGGLGVYLSSYVRDFYIQQTTDRLFAETHLAANGLSDLIAASPNDPQINTLAKQYSEAIQGRVTVILPDGRVVGESELPLNQLENHLNRPEVQAALQNREAAVIRFSDTLKTDLLYAAHPLTRDGKVTGVVRVAFSLSQVNDGVRQLQNLIAAATAGAGLLTVVLAFWIISITLRPLRNLSTSVEQIRSGLTPDLQPARGKDEISGLQNAFNSLYAEMQTRFVELQAERRKFEAVLMNMTDGIIIADAEGIVRLINPAAERIFDVTPSQREQSLTEVVRTHQIVDLWRKCQVSPGQPAVMIELNTGKHTLEAVATNLGAAMDGAVLLMIQDLTRIRKLETVRRDFISNVSHELRTPLASLKALTETLQEGALEDPPAARRFLSQMEDEIDNLTQMVRELLELSKIESGRVPLQRRACVPANLISAPAERMRLQAERAGLSIVLECPDDLPLVNADAVRIEQVMVNLIHNAIKFTPPGGYVKVGAYIREKNVAFFVYDTGVGIQPENLTRIFERFYKADRSRSGGGTGLGLSIARHMIEAHGGRIWAESEPGHGSTFTFTLPLA